MQYANQPNQNVHLFPVAMHLVPVSGLYNFSIIPNNENEWQNLVEFIYFA